MQLRGSLLDIVTGKSPVLATKSVADKPGVAAVLRMQALHILLRSTTLDPMAVRPVDMGELVASTVNMVVDSLDDPSMPLNGSILDQLSQLLQSAVDDPALMISAASALMPSLQDAAGQEACVKNWQAAESFPGFAQLCRLV